MVSVFQANIRGMNCLSTLHLPGLCHALGENSVQAFRRRLEAVAAGDIAQGIAAKLMPQRGIGQQTLDIPGHAATVLWIAEVGAVTIEQNARNGAACTGDNRQSACLRFENGHADRFIDGGPHEQFRLVRCDASLVYPD